MFLDQWHETEVIQTFIEFPIPKEIIFLLKSEEITSALVKLQP